MLEYSPCDLPLGLLEIAVDGRITKRLDACCPTHCVGLPGQGFYFSELVASSLPSIEHEVTLTIVPRDRGRSNCTFAGNLFMVVGLIGQMAVRQ